MTRATALIVSAAVCLLGVVFAARVPGVVHAQAQKVDFGRDVQPIFRHSADGQSVRLESLRVIER